MNCKVFPFMTSSSCTEPPNEKRFETYRRKNEILNWTLLYLRLTWNFPFKDECANLMSSSTLGIHGFVDLIFSIKITRIILSGNKKGLFVFAFSVITAGDYYAGKEKWHHTACVILPQVQPNLRWYSQAQPPFLQLGQKQPGRRWRHNCFKCRVWRLVWAAARPPSSAAGQPCPGWAAVTVGALTFL